jgi:hypothetical protein
MTHALACVREKKQGKDPSFAYMLLDTKRMMRPLTEIVKFKR